MNKIWVLGLGPGHKDYTLPIVKKKLLEADIVYGGKRHLSDLDLPGEKRYLKMPLEACIEDIKSVYKNKQVAVLVSGDTGFYSFLETLKRHLDTEVLETYPGISSLQYLFARLNKSYHHAFIGSVHGRDMLEEDLVNQPLCGLLTDKKMTPKAIKDLLVKYNKSAKLYIGENLSYEDEKITYLHTDDQIEDTYSNLCVVVIEHD